MSADLIETIYQELKRIGSCKSRSQFSVDWLGREEAYYRSAISRGSTISISAQVYLTATLRNIGMCFGRGDFPFLVPKGHVILDLHGKCLEDLFSRVTSDAVSNELE